MNLHSVSARGRKVKQRVGRGGKRGTTSGRGQKGQKSRAGRRIRPAVRDLLLKFPKSRGVRHRSIVAKPFVVNLGTLLPLLKKVVPAKAGTPLRIDASVLKAVGILPLGYRGRIKILARGEVSEPLLIAKGIAVSKNATIKITAAGGKTE